MTGITPWMLAASRRLLSARHPVIHEFRQGAFSFTIRNTGETCWVTAVFPGGARLAYRAVLAPHDTLEITKTRHARNHITLLCRCAVGVYTVDLTFPDAERPLFHCVTTLEPAAALHMPYWPRDLMPLGKKGIAAGRVHIHQAGLRAGLLYASLTRPKGGSVLYFQHLTSLNAYNQATQTSAADTVGGNWPEIGFALPPANGKALKPGKTYTLSDAFLLFSETIPAKEADMAEQYLNMLATVYLHLPKPPTRYMHWPDVLHKSLNDLTLQPGCWTQAAGHPYLNAYNCDYKTPPEIMVQLAVLLPLMDYEEWAGKKLPVTAKMKDGLEAFYDEKLKSIARWLPSHEQYLDGTEEHKKPRVMDAWYLHHPLINLSRMALKDNKRATALFLESVEYAVKAGRHFKYNWPVFYNVDTLEVIKAETQPGKGGEKDVAGIYAYVMLQAYELTGRRRFLQEAEKAAKTLTGKGFELFYQANNTAFSAGALLRLYKHTGKPLFLRLSYLCLANIFNNMWLWECNYGYAANYPTFFAFFPLKDAPYTAVYEEQEGFAAFHDYLHEADGIGILPAASLLMAEFIRYMLHRAAYYYPPLLPSDMLSSTPVSGELDADKWIPLEDLQDGWKQSGSIGQEVYGAGLPFVVLPRHYYAIPELALKLYVDYPSGHYIYRRRQKTLHFSIQGDGRLTCRLLLIPLNGKQPPAAAVTGRRHGAYSGRKNPDGYLEYEVHGNQKMTITFRGQQKR